MELKTYKCYIGGKLMPWGKGTVVKGAPGFVFLAGSTGIVEGYDPKAPDYVERGGVVQGVAAQWRVALEKIKAYLEELGTSLDNIVKMTFFIKGPFPEGVGQSPNFRLDVVDEFFREHCPRLCSDNNPAPTEIIGVAGLAHKDQVVEIVCIAALPE